MASPLLARTALLGAAVLAVALFVGVPSLGQGVTQPQGELADADCYGHHKQEGFRSMDLFPEVIAEVPQGQPFQFNLTIRNPWLHDVLELYAFVNLTDAPGLSFPGEKEPVTKSERGSITGQPGVFVRKTHEFAIEPNATEFVVLLLGDPGPAPALPVGAQARNDFDLTVESPNGQLVFVGPDPGTDYTTAPTWVEEIRVNHENLTRGGVGTWKATVAYRGLTPQGAYEVAATTYYNLSRATELLLPGPEKLGPGEEHVFTFTVNSRSEAALQLMRYGGRADTYHAHTDRNIGDHGNHTKWATMSFETGTELVIGSAIVSRGDIDLLSPILRRWGQILGFAASFLVIPSLVLGGTFGRGSVTLLNRMFGSPRRRVLFHNAASFWLLGLSVLHMFLFLYEAFWNWSHGLVWGGLALAAMIGLGVTGATQRSFVAQWGFARWRFVHFGLGAILVVFILIHLIADGSHLAPIRDAFG